VVPTVVEGPRLPAGYSAYYRWMLFSGPRLQNRQVLTKQAEAAPGRRRLIHSHTYLFFGLTIATIAIAGCSISSKPTATASASVTESTLISAPTIESAGTTSTSAADDLSAVKTFGKQTQNHVEGTVAYPESPPIGGDHSAKWQNCGAYAEPIPNEQAVHSIEHGAVWVTYQPDLPSGDVKLLQALAVGQTHVLVSPYPGLSSPVVLTAWSTQLAVKDAKSPVIGAFIKKYQEGPQTPEPGAPCSGAIGTPL
jgi:hypothetical protein